MLELTPGVITGVMIAVVVFLMLGRKNNGL
jgi:hypothetical protein